MIYEKIESEWAVDSKIDITDLSAAQQATLELHSKYHRYHNTIKMKLRELESIKDKALLLKTDYYLGLLPREVLKEHGWEPFQRKIIKSELSLFLNADTDIIETNLKIAEYAQAVEFLESIIRSIHNRNQAIRNIVDNNRYNGGN